MRRRTCRGADGKKRANDSLQLHPRPLLQPATPPTTPPTSPPTTPLPHCTHTHTGQSALQTKRRPHGSVRFAAIAYH